MGYIRMEAMPVAAAIILKIRKMSEEYESIVIGGGPAGSVVAGTLAQKGRKVLLLERDVFPRFHIGESLLPASMPLLRRFGVGEKMKEEGFIVKHGARITSACGKRDIKIYFKNGLGNQEPAALQVTRSIFDKMLLDHAAESGAEVRVGHQVTGLDLDGAEAEVEWKDPEGTTHRGRTPWLIDASGRSSMVGQKLSLKQRYHRLTKFAVFAHYEGMGREKGIDGGLIHMVRASDRWFWMIPLTETRTSVGVVLDQDDFKKVGLEPEAFLDRSIQEQPEVGKWMTDARRVGDVHAAGDYSYRNQQLFGKNWILAGDAAGFIDPVFSTGVFIGLHSGEQAALQVDGFLAGRLRHHDLIQYQRNLFEIFDLYLGMVSRWYTQPFAEIFLHPTERFQMAAAVNAMLCGLTRLPMSIRVRLGLVKLFTALQGYYPVVPRLALEPEPS